MIGVFQVPSPTLSCAYMEPVQLPARLCGGGTWAPGALAVTRVYCVALFKMANNIVNKMPFHPTMASREVLSP